jgi:RND family efflux transporter MFP subunit
MPRLVNPAAVAAATLVALLGTGAFVLHATAADPATTGTPAGGQPALTVQVVRPEPADLPQSVTAGGSLHAWQEASIGAEGAGWRLAEVRAEVGDRVRRGQVLAVFASDLAEADLAQTRATVAEAEAALAEAAANAQRARDLAPSGALSAQQITQFETAERTARARLEAQQAAARVQQLRLAQTRVVAPDDGIVSSRTATVGAVVPAGQELFRLIRQGRLEWRAEVAETDLGAIRPGMPVRIEPAGGGAVDGRVRALAPTVDPATRNGIVFVDLPSPGAAKAGMFARGSFETGRSRGLTLPQGAVQLRDGFAVVFRVGADGRVAQTKVQTGRRVGDRIEIRGGLEAGTPVVASGVAFLADGDLVRVVDGAPAAPRAQ